MGRLRAPQAAGDWSRPAKRRGRGGRERRRNTCRCGSSGRDTRRARDGVHRPGLSRGGGPGSRWLEPARTLTRPVGRGHRGRPRARALERGSRVPRLPARLARRPRGRGPARCRPRSRRGAGGTRPWLARRASHRHRREGCATGRRRGQSRPRRPDRFRRRQGRVRGTQHQGRRATARGIGCP